MLFPAAHALLARKKDHGRAEAALIALTRINDGREIPVSRSKAGEADCPAVT
jgi:hypothetical protein